MKTICLIDSTIFCEIIDVPRMASQKESVAEELIGKYNSGETLLLPTTTILETGNHIGQNGDGGARRRTALRFVEQVRMAVSGVAPFLVTPLFSADTINEWLDEFPNWVAHSDSKGKGSGFGDLTIYKEWDRQCKLNPLGRVYIWSLDAHLQSFDRRP